MDNAKITPELGTLKAKLRAVWSAGDFSEIAKAYSAGAADFVSGLGIEVGQEVLDVACGAGNLALPAARSGAKVTGVDIAEYLVGQANANAAAEGLNVRFEVGDVEDLPFEDGSFDVVMSMFGAMFAPRPDVTASELKRVCRPGGLIAMANWTPAGFVGQMFKITGEHVKPPAGMPSPLLWGDEDSVNRRFASGVDSVKFEKKEIAFAFPFGPAEVVEHFRKFYGPTQKAFEALDIDGQNALRNDLEQLWHSNNKVSDGTTRVYAEYMEIKVRRS